jgi:hypothetical protein
MVAGLRSLAGVKRPMKTFEADAAMFDLLEKSAALRTFAEGSKVYESDVIRRTLLEHAATDTVRLAVDQFEARVAEMKPEDREPARELFERKLSELLSACEYHGITVELPKSKGRK